MFNTSIVLDRLGMFQSRCVRTSTQNLTTNIEKRKIITKDEFNAVFLNKKPLLITGGLAWSAFDSWSHTELAKRYPKIKSNLYSFDVKNNHEKITETPLTLSDAIQLMQSSKPRTKNYYIMRQSIKHYFPELLNELSGIPWCPSASDGEANLWIGEQGNKTALHFDSTDNFLVQVDGCKEVFIFHPTKNPLPINNPFSGGRLNFCQKKFVDEFEPKNLSFSQIKGGSRVTLEKGCCLYIPTGWWHQVNTISKSISVNFFFSSLGKYKSCKQAILAFQALSTYKDLYPLAVREIINQCNFDNSVDTAKNLIKEQQFELALMTIGVVYEEILEYMGEYYLKKGVAFTDRKSLLNKVFIDFDFKEETIAREANKLEQLIADALNKKALSSKQGDDFMEIILMVEDFKNAIPKVIDIENIKQASYQSNTGLSNELHH